MLERVSGLRFNEDFFCGYSPERINPGDKQHRLTRITYVTPETAETMDELYAPIVTAGRHKAVTTQEGETAGGFPSGRSALPCIGLAQNCRRICAVMPKAWTLPEKRASARTEAFSCLAAPIWPGFSTLR